MPPTDESRIRFQDGSEIDSHCFASSGQSCLARLSHRPTTQGYSHSTRHHPSTLALAILKLLQTARQRLSASHKGCRSVALPHSSIGAPSRQPATPTRPYGLPVDDLFATLLFDRQRAYQSQSRVSPAPVAGTEKTKSTKQHTGAQIPHPPQIPFGLHVRNPEEAHPGHGDVPLPGYQNRVMVSKTPTTTKENPKKRAASARVTPRITKRLKTEANSKRKLDDKSSMGNRVRTAMSATSNKEIEIITISDSDDHDDGYQLVQRPKTQRKNDLTAEFSAPNITIHKDDDDDVKQNFPISAVNPEPIHLGPTPSPSKEIDAEVPIWDFGSLDSSNSPPPPRNLYPAPLPLPRQHRLRNAMAVTEKEHADEKEQLRHALDAVKAELARLKATHEKEKSDRELLQARASSSTSLEMQRLNRDLSTERENLRIAIRERNQLRIDNDNGNAQNAQLTRELQAEKQRRSDDKAEHERIVKDMLKVTPAPPPASSSSALGGANGRLGTGNEGLRAAARPSTSSTFFTTSSSSRIRQGQSIFPSPAPSSTTTTTSSSTPSMLTEEQKAENLRNAYLALKLRSDAIQAAAGDLLHTTRGMNLRNFGEMGRYLRLMKEALDEDARVVAEKAAADREKAERKRAEERKKRDEADDDEDAK